MYLINNTEHIDIVKGVIKELETAEDNIHLKTEDGEEVLINRVLLSIVFPFLGVILDENVLVSHPPVFLIPLEMRVLKMVMDIKLRGLVNITDDEDIDRISAACYTLGEEIDADKFVKDSSDKFLDMKLEVEAPDSIEKDSISDNLETQGSTFTFRNKKRAGLKKKERCNKCKFYSKRGALKAHIAEAHIGKDSCKPEVVAETDTDVNDDIVKVETMSNQVLVKTEKASMGRKCNYCKQDLPRNSLTDHIKEVHPEREIFECETCGYECILKSILITHMKEIHREKTTCNYCQKDIKSIESHLEKYHPEQLDMYPCIQCPYAAFDEHRLALHMRKMHESKRGKCGKCNKRVHDIVNHNKKHEMNKFKCIPCSKSFSVKRDLCRHILYPYIV